VVGVKNYGAAVDARFDAVVGGRDDGGSNFGWRQPMKGRAEHDPELVADPSATA